MSAAERVVADLLDHELVVPGGELLYDPPAPAAPARVLGPDLPLRVAVVVCVLGEHDAHRRPAPECEQPLDRRERPLGGGHRQRPTRLDKVVLHVDDDQRRARRIEPNCVGELVFGTSTSPLTSLASSASPRIPPERY